MIPYKSNVLKAAPQTLEKRLEILDAVRRLAAQYEQHERLQRWQIELTLREQIHKQFTTPAGKRCRFPFPTFENTAPTSRACRRAIPAAGSGRKTAAAKPASLRARPPILLLIVPRRLLSASRRSKPAR